MTLTRLHTGTKTRLCRLVHTYRLVRNHTNAHTYSLEIPRNSHVRDHVAHIDHLTLVSRVWGQWEHFTCTHLLTRHQLYCVAPAQTDKYCSCVFSRHGNCMQSEAPFSSPQRLNKLKAGKKESESIKSQRTWPPGVLGEQKRQHCSCISVCWCVCRVESSILWQWGLALPLVL